jgi:23S rRNA pseudouridine1911/1915/1917 synthase
LVVHTAAGHSIGTLVNAILHHCRLNLYWIGSEMHLGIVRRLEKNFYGIIVALKRDIFVLN